MLHVTVGLLMIVTFIAAQAFPAELVLALGATNVCTTSILLD